MAQSESQFINELKNEMKKNPFSLPTMGEMMRNAAEGFDFAAKGRKTYGVADYKQPEVVGGHIESQIVSRFRLRTDQTKADQALRDAVKSNAIAPISKEDIEHELSFREKEESYNKKNSDQEKDAEARNEQLSDVPMEDLKKKSAYLKGKLDEDIDYDDTYSQGEREYHKQYLEAVEDLIKTEGSKGKLFGNYKKHIALAREKYWFYTTERERIIGREQVKILMQKDEYKANLAQAKEADPFPDLTDTIRSISVNIRDFNKPEEYEALKKAIIEYREYSLRVYELKKQFDVLSKAKANNGLAAFKKSAEMELSVWKFHADACALCINRLVNPEKTPIIDGAYSAQAGFIEKHFGIKMDGIDTSVPIKDQRISRRIGFESSDSDFTETQDLPSPDRTYFRDSMQSFYGYGDMTDDMKKAGLKPLRHPLYDPSFVGFGMREYGYGLGTNPLYRSTGLDIQKFYEWNATRISAFPVADMIIKERGLRGKDSVNCLDDCQNISVLLQALPSLSEERNPLSGQSYVRINFHGYREENGQFVSQADKPLDITEVSSEKTEVLSVLDKIYTIRGSKDGDAVKNAILGMLPLINAAFDDIDAFMTVGKTSEIFTVKSHEEVFNNTAGLPTFERKARQLRDIIGSILATKGLLREIGDDANEDLPETLMHKWMFLNRVLNYVDYRVQVMEKGYDSTPEEWAEDTTTVKSFWDKTDFDKQEGYEKAGEFLRDIPGRILRGPAHESDGQGDGVVAPSVASEVEQPDILDIPAEDEEAHWSDKDKKTWRKWNADLNAAIEESLVREAKWNSLIDGFSRVERRFLRREFYESGAFRTRSAQKQAIAGDLLKATDHGAYSSEYFSAVTRIGQINGLLEDAPTAELRSEKAELEANLVSLRKKMDAILEDVDRRADELLKLIKQPDDEQAILKSNVDALRREAEKKAGAHNDGSEDAALMDSAMPKIIGLRASIDGQKPEYDQASEQIADVIELLKPRFTSESQAFILRCANRIRRNVRDLAGGLTKKDEEEILRRADKYDETASTPDPDPFYLSDIVQVAQDEVNRIEPGFDAPYISVVMKAALNAKVQLDYVKREPETRAISFSEKVTVATFNPKSKVLYSKPKEGTLSEEEALHVSRLEQTRLVRKANSEAGNLAADQLERIKVAERTIKSEREAYISGIKTVGGAPLAALQTEDLDEDYKEILSSLGCLLVPLDKKAGDEIMEQQYSDLMGNVRTLLIDSDDDQKVAPAIAPTMQALNAAYEDISRFVHSPAGTAMLAQRTPCNFFTLRGEPVEKDNYTTDINGMAALRLKTDCLLEVTHLILGLDIVSDADVNKAMRMSDNLEELSDFLNWREGILAEVKANIGGTVGDHLTSYMSRDPKTDKPELDSEHGVRTIDYIYDVRENPEDWSREAFTWEGE